MLYTQFSQADTGDVAPLPDTCLDTCLRTHQHTCLCTGRRRGHACTARQHSRRIFRPAPRAEALATGVVHIYLDIPVFVRIYTYVHMHVAVR